MSAQQSKGDPLDTEAYASCVRGFAVRRLDPERGPEMVEVIVGTRLLPSARRQG